MQDDVSADYVIRVLKDMGEIPADGWDDLLRAQPAPSPFMRHAYPVSYTHLTLPTICSV